MVLGKKCIKHAKRCINIELIVSKRWWIFFYCTYIDINLCCNSNSLTLDQINNEVL